jgi:branched-chain amino acid transport system ATP-binding protein
MIELQSVSSVYGVVPIKREVSLNVREGELGCLLGPNGAGKTTTFRVISGLIAPSAGRISIMNRPLASLRTELLAGPGIAFVPEARRLFPGLSVYENIRLGYAATGRKGAFEEALDAAAARFPLIRQQAGAPSGGEQAMVAFARAIVGAPKLLVMDEPLLGMSPRLISVPLSNSADGS